MVMTSSHAEDCGNTPTMASLAMSIMSVSDIFSRVLGGLVINSGRVKVTTLYVAVLAVNTAALSSVAAFGHLNYATLVVSLTVSSACAGCAVSLMPVLLGNALGVHRVRSAYALVSFASGALNLTIPYAFGVLKDVTGTWNASFYMCASISGAVALLNLVSMGVARKWADSMDARRMLNHKVNT